MSDNARFAFSLRQPLFLFVFVRNVDCWSFPSRQPGLPEAGGSNVLKFLQEFRGLSDPSRRRYMTAQLRETDFSARICLAGKLSSLMWLFAVVRVSERWGVEVAAPRQ